MTLPGITALPTPPTRSMDNDTFVAAADAFVAALAQLVSDINAWSAQVPAQVSPANFNTTSASSVAIGTGSKSFTVDTGKLIYVSQWLLIASSASPTNYMVGQVTAYNSGTGALTVNVLYSSGSGTLASWIIGPAPAPNTTVNPRTITAGTTSGTITPDSANADQYLILGLSGATAIAAPSGAPVAGQKLMLRIKDNGSSQTLTWDAIYKAYGSVSLPAATTPGKSQYVGMIYSATDAKWNVVASAIEQ